MSDAPRVVLASESPRRREILAQVLSDFAVIPSGVDEESVEGVAPSETASRTALAKAEEVARRLDEGLVLAADTVIDLEGTLLGKPDDGEHAFEILRRLRGVRHRVLTALVVRDVRHGVRIGSVVSTAVDMAPFTDREIRDYIATGEPMDKAGAYAIQGLGGALVAGIEGCYSNVVGLPVCETAALLLRIAPGLSLKSSECRGPSGRLCPRQGG
jgi:septum formation protein